MRRLLVALRGVSITDLHLYGGLVLAVVGGEIIWPGVGYVVAGAALFWLAIRKVS